MTKAKENTEISKASIIEKFYMMCVVFMTIGLSITYFAEEAIKILTTKEFHVAIWITPIYIFLLSIFNCRVSNKHATFNCRKNEIFNTWIRC